MATLELDRVSKAFGNNVVLDTISLEVLDNEFFCIFGPPSSGKSTILRLFLGLATPDSGRVLINGRDVSGLPPSERDLAMVFQNLALFPHLTARENLAFPLRERGVPDREIDPRVNEVAGKLRISKLLQKQPGQLSGGERQRVAIGRALVRDPGAYLMDEPIAALDARLREEMRVELKRLQRESGHTLVYVTHDQEEAMSIGDRIAIIGDGKIVQSGTPAEIYSQPNSRYVAELVGSPPMNFIRGRVSNGVFNADGVGLSVEVGEDVPNSIVDLAIRPEDIGITAAGDTPGNNRARVYEIEPLGAYAIVDVELGDSVLQAQVQGQPDLAPNDPVDLSIDGDHCHFFNPDDGSRLVHAFEGNG